LSMRADGKPASKISEATGYNADYVSRIASNYAKNVLRDMGRHYGGIRRNMSCDEEIAILKPFLEKFDKVHCLWYPRLGLPMKKRLDILSAAVKFMVFCIAMDGEK